MYAPQVLDDSTGTAPATQYRAALAWEIYCRETAGSMNVQDFWEQLSTHVKAIYLRKADDTANTFNCMTYS
jgi:hypothetical protein